MTLDDFYEMGGIRARSPKFRQKWYEAVELCGEQLMRHESPYVAVSGGKDSGVLAYLVGQAAKMSGVSCRVWAYVSDASFPGTEETIQKIVDHAGLPLDLDRCPFSAFETMSSKQRRAFGKTGTFYSAVRAYAADKDLSFVGVRASESKRRREAAKVHGQVFHSVSMGDVDTCYPLLWFRLEDIAAATVNFKIPLHPVYSKQSVYTGTNCNGENSFIRLGYAVSRDLLKYGTTVFMRLNYPEIYAKVLEVYPEIRNET